MGGLRVAAIASLTPLEELDQHSFLVDTRSQLRMCARWADERGHTVTRQLVFSGVRHDLCALWADVEGGTVDLFVAANEQVLSRALLSVPEFADECAKRGVGLESANLPEPVYDAAMKADVHRRLSMPTAGYDGC
ncbi:recombinase family protein [Streptomyces albipurpureus]|uniref:Recombinase family protein n=1 Tax=Streptomyces albipurpureus TaxID=2897419 RepID=A0ABT0UHH0_9ACTN|nr:recombinase family protein [Streptomyces sp. CWNU-1]MCM2386918.1 recombinase family protein [Streptomyces sp. CWNU-1]